MARFVFGVTLADQPGALGSVASSIGSLGGDLVDIDVLERGHGFARDELTVDLAHEDLAELVARRLRELDGVTVDHVSAVDVDGHHLVVDALEVAGALVAENDVGGVLEALVSGVVAAFTASWAAVLVDGRSRPIAEAGAVPPASITRADPIGAEGVEDQFAAEVGHGGARLVVGREGWPLRARERRELSTLARIGGARWAELERHATRQAAPNRQA